MPVQFDEQNYAQTSYSGFDQPKGLSGKLINWGIAKDQRSANMVLMIVFVIVLVITLGVIIFSNSSEPDINYPPPETVGTEVLF